MAGIIDHGRVGDVARTTIEVHHVDDTRSRLRRAEYRLDHSLLKSSTYSATSRDYGPADLFQGKACPVCRPHASFWLIVELRENALLLPIIGAMYNSRVFSEHSTTVHMRSGSFYAYGRHSFLSPVDMLVLIKLVGDHSTHPVSGKLPVNDASGDNYYAAVRRLYCFCFGPCFRYL